MNRPQIKGRNLANERTCLFTPKGELIWISPAWMAGKVSEQEADRLRKRTLGTNYQEFIYSDEFNDDLPGLLAWFADGQESTHHFRAMEPSSGQMLHVTYFKVHYQDNWLVFGVVKPAPVLPAPPCVADLDSSGGGIIQN